MRLLFVITFIGSLWACSQPTKRPHFGKGSGEQTPATGDPEGGEPGDGQDVPSIACDALDQACLALKYPEGSKCDVAFSKEQDGIRVLTNEEAKNSLNAALGMDFSKELSTLPRTDQGSKFDNAMAKAAPGQNIVDNWLDVSFNVAKSFTENAAAIGKLVSCSAMSRDCSDAIVKSIGGVLWRGPVSKADLDLYYTVFSSGKSDFKEALVRTISAILLDPRFLYKADFSDSGDSLSAYELATRMSYFLWQSAPDKALLAKAADGSLLKASVRSAEIKRMLAQPQAEVAFRNFMRNWLLLGNIDNLQIMGETIDPAAKRDDVLNKLTTMVFQGNNDVRMAFGKDDENVLTMPGVLGGLQVSSGTSPVKRGLYFSSRILCRKVPPPPGNAGAFKAETLKADATPRERLKLHEDNPSCAACHSTVDPIGLGLETFDALGRNRTQYDTQKPIDTAGKMRLDGKEFSFSDASTMMKAIGSSDDLSACMTVTLAEYALGSEPSGTNACELSSIQQQFEKSGYQWKSLVQAIIESPSFNRKAGQ